MFWDRSKLAWLITNKILRLNKDYLIIIVVLLPDIISIRTSNS